MCAVFYTDRLMEKRKRRGNCDLSLLLTNFKPNENTSFCGKFAAINIKDLFAAHRIEAHRTVCIHSAPAELLQIWAKICAAECSDANDMQNKQDQNQWNH